MKKIVLSSLALLAITAFAQAQTVGKPANDGFENWTLSTKTLQQEPNQYITTEQILLEVIPGGTPSTDDYVARSTDKRSGSYAVKLTSINNATAGGVIPGIIITADSVGQIFGGGGSFGAPYNSTVRPGALKLYYKATINGGDTAQIQLFASKYDSTAGQRNFLAGGNGIVTESASNWTELTIPLEYDPSFEDVPDSVAIIMASGNFQGQTTEGTTLSVDDMSFTKEVEGRINPKAGSFVTVFPNPTAETLKIKLDEFSGKNTEVIILDALGKNVITKTATINGTELQVNVADLQAGVYFVRVKGDNKTFVSQFTKMK